MPDSTPGETEDDYRGDLLDDWRQAAECRGLNPSIFFPERGDASGIALALSICKRCPVQKECLNEYLFEDDGVFGGTSGRQRRAMRSKIGQIRSCRTCAKDFRRVHPGQWYCSLDCRMIVKKQLSAPKVGL